MLTPKNARGRPVTRLCLALETFRRTDEGRARDAKAFLGHFFPQDKDGARDRLFVHLPKEVRADLLASWGIRGKKSALRDDDEKVRVTVSDALAAGDIDANVIEKSVTPEILVDWVPLEDWWSFWRGSVLPAASVRRALTVARELSLFDERWFLDHLELKPQRSKATDVICASLTKDQVAAWLHAIHERGDASPTGLVVALGWDTILAKTANEALVHALDALARQIGLVDDGPSEQKADAPGALPERPSTGLARPISKPEPKSDAAHVKPASPPAIAVVPALPPPSTIVTPAVAVAVLPSARALFGAPTDLPPMRPPAATLSGVGEPPVFESMAAEVAIPTFQLPGEEPIWAPPRAEPGDMGWDLVHGVKLPMSTNVQPKYNFADDDEPTSELALPNDTRRRDTRA